MDRSGLAAAIAPFFLCLPCLLVAVAAAGGIAPFSGAAAWVTDNAIITALGLTVAVTVGVSIMTYRRPGARVARQGYFSPDGVSASS